jgi:hypothetical protein
LHAHHGGGDHGDASCGDQALAKRIAVAVPPGDQVVFSLQTPCSLRKQTTI